MFIYRGGFALVWLGFDKLHNNRKVAMKQIIKSNSENCKKELMFGELFFDENGRIREEFNEYNGFFKLILKITIISKRN